MRTEFRLEYLSKEEESKPQVLQQPVAVRVTLEGEMKLADAIIALLKTKYTMIY